MKMRYYWTILIIWFLLPLVVKSLLNYVMEETGTVLYWGVMGFFLVIVHIVEGQRLHYYVQRIYPEEYKKIQEIGGKELIPKPSSARARFDALISISHDEDIKLVYLIAHTKSVIKFTYVSIIAMITFIVLYWMIL